MYGHLYGGVSVSKGEQIGSGGPGGDPVNWGSCKPGTGTGTCAAFWRYIFTFPYWRASNCQRDSDFDCDYLRVLGFWFWR